MTGNLQDQGITALKVPSRNEVKNMLKSCGISVIRLAKQLGVPLHYLDYNLAGNQRMKPEVYLKVKNALDEINLSDKKVFFSDPDDSSSAKDDAPSAEKPLVPELPGLEEYGIKIFPVLKKFILVNDKLDLSPENISGLAFFKYPYTLKCFCYENYGDYMTDKSSAQSLNDGDYLLVDVQKKIFSGDVVIARIGEGGRDVIRQVIFSPDDKVTLKCFNPKYPDIVLQRNEILHMAKVCYKHSKEVAL
jgi:hypothetical protein